MHLEGVIAHGPTASGYLTRIFGNDEATRSTSIRPSSAARIRLFSADPRQLLPEARI